MYTASWRDVVVPILRELDVPAMFFVTTSLVGRAGNLSWDDCRAIAAAGFDFGSHTVTHQRLTDQSDADCRREFADSKRELERELEREILDFAAPYGSAVDFGEREVAYARETGYRSFASTLRPAMHPGDSPLAINRQGLHPAWPLWAVRTRVHD